MQIAQVKAELASLGADVDEQPGDTASDRGLSATIVLGAHQNSTLRAYLRTVGDRLGYISLDGLAEWRGPALPLSDIYIERDLTPQAAGMPTATLAGLLADNHTRILIASELGGGKTIAIRRLALACIGLHSGDERQMAFFPRMLDSAPIPVVLDSYDIARAMAALDVAGRQLGLWDVIEYTFQHDGFASALPAIEQALRAGLGLVMIDGLDEIMVGERGRNLPAMISRFVARYPDSRYVFTCRHLSNLSTASLFGFSHYSLPPLENEQLDALIVAYYPLLTPLSALTFDEPESYTRRICSSIRTHERLRTMASNPLGAVVCLLTEAEGQPLPSARGVVFTRMIDLLLERWEQRRSEEAIAPLASMLDVEQLARLEMRLALLQPLALALQLRPDLSGDMPATMRYPEVEPWLRESLMHMGVEWRRAVEHVIPQLLQWLCRHGLLATNESSSEYAMPWRSLREYLAARALAAQQDFPTRAHSLAAEPRWRETLLLAVRELALGAGVYAARELLRLLLESAQHSSERAVSDTLLAAECLIEFESIGTPERAILAELQERLQDIMRMREVAASERVRAGMLLGQLGDPRFATMLPPLVRVPAGAFLLGTRDGYEDEGPQQWVDIPAFAIGTYPVTNREYGRFLDEMPSQPRPKYWYDQSYNNPSQPVVGVTWGDAVAYCQWLTVKLRATGLLPATMEVRLPLEVEWEKVASWDARRRSKRTYPWGDAWLSGAANTTEGRGAWTTAPVGCFPAGQSAYGAHDMIGNVWEWTMSEYASYPGALASFHEAGSYTLRGSSCASLPTHARCTYRSRLPVDYWRYHLGFRVVLGLPLITLAADEG
ncbi:SUMF1/EgtB/PvdO family nonheme iron enzyme [Chloroflexia bacterium SDU3-3]|nr:SUMF1/EgtB/PvdO family nonheme iron enzyme [Chloroflexia bacterium SDU3-3]